MAGEDARVETLVCNDKALICGENDLFWVEVIVNGFKDCSINASSMQDAERMAPEVERLVKSVYRKAYRDGYHSCQQVIKDSLGLPREGANEITRLRRRVEELESHLSLRIEMTTR